MRWTLVSGAVIGVIEVKRSIGIDELTASCALHSALPDYHSPAFTLCLVCCVVPAGYGATCHQRHRLWFRHQALSLAGHEGLRAACLAIGSGWV